MENKIYCPMNVANFCCGERCAWWDSEWNMCCVKTSLCGIDNKLDKIDDSLYDINVTIRGENE